MKKTAATLLALLYLVVVSAASGQQQALEKSSEDDEAVIKVTTVNIGLPVTVFNDKGRFVRNLKRDNFRIFENNQPQQIVEFHSQADLPLNIALLMDTSTSVRNRLEFEKTAIKHFLSSVLEGSKDRVAFCTFDTNIEMRADFTNDLPKVMSSVDAIKAIGGQTSFYDAIFKVCRENMGRNSSHRRVVVAITDGADTNSTHTLAQTIALAQRTETAIYAISTKGGSVYRVEGSEYLNADDKDLRRLCRDTGGEVFFPDNAEDLIKSFTQVTDFLRNQYILVYEPTTSGDGKFHQIEVRMVGQKGLSALTRQGYVAQ
jgi:Ca-activated chloride channel family protein